MAGPAEDQDEFEAYRAQRRGSGQPAATDEVDEFEAYKQSKGRKKKGATGKVSMLQAFDTGAQSGARISLADESQGVKSQFNMVAPVGPLGVFSDVGTGLAGLFMENNAEKTGKPLDPRYTQARDFSRNALATAREDRPLTAFAGEVLGSGVYPGGALRLGAPIAKETVKLGLIGAGQGAAYGYASGDGDTADRVEGAQFGAAFGGAAGAALPGAASAALPAFRSVKTGAAELADQVVKLFGGTGTAAQGNAQQVAKAAILRSMERSGMTPEKVMEAIQKFGDKPAVLAEVIGQDAVNALTSLTRRPGTTPQKAQSIIEERFGGFVDRAQGDLEKATGFKRGDIEGEKDAAMLARQAAASPVYDQAFSQFPKVASDRLEQLGTTSPTLKSYLGKAEKKMADKAAVEGKPIDQMSQLDFWDLVKRTLDDDLNDAVARKQLDEVRNLSGIKDAFVSELDTLTGGAYAAAREIGGEAPRLQAAFKQGGEALGAKPAAEIQKQVNALNPQDAPFFKAGMTADIANKLDKGMGPNRFGVRDTQNKLRAGLGEAEGGSFLSAMDAEASLRQTGARWAPRMNSVTGTVLESGPSQLGDDLMAAATAAARGDKIGLITQAVNFMRRRGYNQKQIDAMGDLLLSDPMEGLKQLGVRLPQGFTPGSASATPIGQGFEPASRVPTNALSGLRSNEAGFTRTDVATTLAGGAAGWQAGEGLDLNGDGKINWEDNVAGAMYGVGAKYVAKPIVGRAVNAVMPPISPGGRGNQAAKPPVKPAKVHPDNARFETLRKSVEMDARKAGQTLTPEQLEQQTVEQYRALFKSNPRHLGRDSAMEAEQWKSSIADAVAILDETKGAGNYTAYDIEQEAIYNFANSFGRGRLPKDTLSGPAKLLPDTVNPQDLIEEGIDPASLKPQGFGIGPNTSNALQQSAFGSLGGSAYGSQNDVNGDGVIDEQDAYAGALVGGVGLPLAAGALGKVGKPRNALADTATAGMGKPRTPKTALPDYGYDEIQIGKASVELTRVDDRMTINRLKVPENARGRGEASRALDAVLQQADEQGLTVFLTADPVGAGGLSKTQLEAFYKRHGFVPNKGRNKDFSSQAGMVRTPRSTGKPRTPQQAARLETPGSPEYEAAIAKGLDMSTSARMARAKEMGFDTETVLYHGTDQDVRAFELPEKRGVRMTGGNAVYLAESSATANAFARTGRDGANVMPVYVKGKVWDFQNPDHVEQLLTAMRADKSLKPSGSLMGDAGLAMSVKEGDYGVLETGAVKRWMKKNGFEGVRAQERPGEITVAIFDPSNIRSVNAAFDPDKAASPILTAGIGGGGRGPRKPPKPDSPEAIAAEVRKLAKPKPEPTRLEQMVEAGKDASVPPINTMPRQADALGAQAERMAARGLSPIEIYDQTGVAMIPYNGANVPIVSSKMGPEELTRVFYSWLKEPPAKRPEWVQKIIDQAPRKKGLLLTDRERIAAPAQAKALAEQPLPKARFPAGAVALGAGAGALTGIPAGALIGYGATRDQQTSRTAKLPPPNYGATIADRIRNQPATQGSQP
ncbi:hypothetical protein UFOVP399_31 [uncultured Caudovirales phage]|uniref:N-acetyltransferase domain-containing protein n=1 Tax=uncultured Caudovirales phage TaxID=2100421 RepID=A0A6J5M760_9CAUD|nr:hypothetical protein UFOVP399_31 [uncultured Caudovirales phage]